MARRNPQIEFLERENKFLREQFEKLFAEPGDIPFTPCDNSCIVSSRRDGMMTNGGCRCDERRLRQAVQWWKRRAQFLQATIVLFKDGDFVEQWDSTSPKIREMIEKEIARATGKP